MYVDVSLLLNLGRLSDVSSRREVQLHGLEATECFWKVGNLQHTKIYTIRITQ